MFFIRTYSARALALVLTPTLRRAFAFGVLWFGMFAVNDAWSKVLPGTASVEESVVECAVDLTSTEPVASIAKICTVKSSEDMLSVALFRVDGEVDIWNVIRVQPLAPSFPFQSVGRSSLLIVEGPESEMQKWLSTVDAEGRLQSLRVSYRGFTVTASGWSTPTLQLAATH